MLAEPCTRIWLLVLPLALPSLLPQPTEEATSAPTPHQNGITTFNAATTMVDSLQLEPAWFTVLMPGLPEVLHVPKLELTSALVTAKLMFPLVLAASKLVFQT